MDEESIIEADILELSHNLSVAPDTVRRCATVVSAIEGEELSSTLEIVLEGIPRGLRMRTYSLKSFVIRVVGRKYTSKEEKDLEKLGGKYNKGLRGGPGWIFPNFRKPVVRRYILSGKPRVGKPPRYHKFRDCRLWRERLQKRNRDVVEGGGVGMTFSRQYTGLEIRRKIVGLGIPPKECMDELYKILSQFHPDETYRGIRALYMISHPGEIERQLEERDFATIRGFTLYTKYRWVEGRPQKVKEEVKRWENETLLAPEMGPDETWAYIDFLS